MKLRSCSSKNEQKSCNIQTLTKARVYNQFQSFFLYGLVEKDRATKLLFRIVKVLVKNIYFLTQFFLKILNIFFVFKNFEKPVTYVLEHYVVHVHTKFQADIIFGSHLRALKRC